MDSLTQAVLGSCIQGAILGKQQGRKAYIYGALLATLPDLDVLIKYADPIAAMTQHRSFSHSIFVLSLCALILTALIRKYKYNKNYNWQRLLITIWLVLITHPLLDCFTVYGTQLFYPLKFTPISWASIFIIDIFFTMPLLIATIISLIVGGTQRAIKFAQYSLMWALFYLGLSLLFKFDAINKSNMAFDNNKIIIARQKTMVMPLTILLWRTIAEDAQGNRYEVLSSVFARRARAPQLLSKRNEFGNYLKNNSYYQRLQWFSDGWMQPQLINGAIVVADQRMMLNGKAIFIFKLADYNATTITACQPQRVKTAISIAPRDVYNAIFAH